MAKILLEDYHGEFLVDRKNIVLKESAAPGKCMATIPGRLSVCGIVNGNGRRYSKAVWENNLKSDSTLMQMIATNSAFGTLEHPADGKVVLTSPISHAVTKAYLKEDEVWGEIQVLNTDEGKKLMALIEFGYNPLVSSRGYGSLIKATDGVDDVDLDFICEGWDVVSKPSFVQAMLIPNREALKTTEAKEGKKSEDKKPQVIENQNFQPKAEEPVKPAHVSTEHSSPETKKTDNTIMDTKALRESLESFKRVDATKLAPARFAEGLSRLSALHQDVAAYQAEDAKRSWEATQLHEEIKAVETVWQEAAAAPVKSLKRIEENNLKLMQVVKAVAEAGVSYKQKLANSIKDVLKNKGLNEELIRRGRGWKSRCDESESEVAALQKKLKTCCEALDLMSKRYKADITEVGKRVIELEFKDKISDPAIAEALKSAKVPKDLLVIREKLEPKSVQQEDKKPDAKPETAPVAEAKKDEVKPDAKSEVTESKKDEAKDESKKDESKKDAVTEDKKDEKKDTTQIIESVHSPKMISESIALSRRLAKASA